MEVTILDAQRARPRAAAGLGAFLRCLAAERPPRWRRATLGVCLVEDRAMAGLNRRYRRCLGTTDVLAFPGDATRGPDGRRHLGDLVISVPRAEAQAAELGHSFSREVRILLVHGYLHLLGYDHERDAGRMRRLQDRLVARLLSSSADVRP